MVLFLWPSRLLTNGVMIIIFFFYPFFHTLSWQTHNRSHQSAPQDRGKGKVRYTVYTQRLWQPFTPHTDLRLIRRAFLYTCLSLKPRSLFTPWKCALAGSWTRVLHNEWLTLYALSYSGFYLLLWMFYVYFVCVMKFERAMLFLTDLKAWVFFYYALWFCYLFCLIRCSVCI